LQCCFDRRHVQLVLRPADDDLRGERSVRDHVAFGLLQADAAVGGAGVGAVVGGNGPVDDVDDAVNRVAFEVGDGPGVGGHGGVVVVGSGVDYAASRAATRARSCWISATRSAITSGVLACIAWYTGFPSASTASFSPVTLFA